MSETMRTGDPLQRTLHPKSDDSACVQKQAASEDEEHALYPIKRFHARTSQIVSEGLMGKQPAEEVALEHVT